jgi:hypothetical protein
MSLLPSSLGTYKFLQVPPNSYFAVTYAADLGVFPKLYEWIRDHGSSYDRQVRSDVFGHADVTCFYLTANMTAYIYITKAFDESKPRNRL